jgi:hypothetical protein
MLHEEERVSDQNPYASPRYPGEANGKPSPIALWLGDRLLLLATGIVCFVAVFATMLAIVVSWKFLTGQSPY